MKNKFYEHVFRISLFLMFLILYPFIGYSTSLLPGQSVRVEFNTTSGEYGPVWTTNNPTLQLSSIGFMCDVTAKAYFGGTATVTCTYKAQVGFTVYNRTKQWSFTCYDTYISISPTSETLSVNESFQIHYGFDRPTFVTPQIQYTGYDYNIVSVSDYGMVTARGEGTTSIYVKSNIGTNTEICTVTVSGTNDDDDDNNDNVTSNNIYAYDEWSPGSNTLIIELDEAGTLSNYISESEMYNIRNLTIKGPLNGTDLRLLRAMAGVDLNGNPTYKGLLEILDLKEAYFVEGGSWYYCNTDYNIYYYTKNLQNSIPDYAFRRCRLSSIRYPKYAYMLGDFCDLINGNTVNNVLIPPGASSIYQVQTSVIPSSMSYVGSLPSKYTQVYCYATIPPEASDIDEIAPNATLYVPKGCAQAYWQAPGWRNFSKIEETLDVYHTLYVKVGENGTFNYKGESLKVKHSVPYSTYRGFEIMETEDVIVEIIPDDGYVISLLKLINNDNVINIPIPSDSTSINIGKISQHSTLEVEFAKEYLVSLSVSPDNAGITTGAGCYFEDNRINVTATPNTGYLFANWSEIDSTIVSYNSNYSFVVSDNRELVANFVENDLSLNISDVVEPSCYGAANGMVTAYAQGGLPPYKYQLEDSIYNTTSGSFIFDNLSAGDYIITVTDNTGFNTITNVYIDEPAELNPGEISSDGQMASVGESFETISSVQDAISDHDTLTYRWKMNGDVIENSNVPQFKPSDLNVGTYIFTREVKDNCSDWMVSDGSWTLTIDAVDLYENYNDIVAIYPNPTHDKVYVVCDNIDDITIVSMTGQIVRYKDVDDNQAIIELHDFPYSIYTLLIRRNDGHIIHKKIIYNR